MPPVLAVIPARYNSTRFPGKALAPLHDRTLIEEVWRRANRTDRIDRLVIATDDRRIADVAAGFGAEVCMTSADHVSGTDRVAEVVRTLEGKEHKEHKEHEGQASYGVVLNIQGDEPLLTPGSLVKLIEPFDSPDPPRMTTLSEPIDNVDELFDPNVVKVVTRNDGRALYFSRSPIPFHRGSARALAPDFRAGLGQRRGGLAGYRKHQGLYGYTRDALLELTALAPSDLEQDEGLEQLRALDAGFSIQVVDSDYRSLSVDTPADLERVSRFMTEASHR